MIFTLLTSCLITYGVHKFKQTETDNEQMKSNEHREMLINNDDLLVSQKKKTTHLNPQHLHFQQSPPERAAAADAPVSSLPHGPAQVSPSLLS